MFNLKAAVLEFDHGLEVTNPSHLLLYVYLLSVGKVYLHHQSPRPGWSKVLLDPDLAKKGLRASSPRVSGGTPGNSVLTLLFLLPVFSVQCCTQCNLFHKLLSEHRALLDEFGQTKAEVAAAGMHHFFLSSA